MRIPLRHLVSVLFLNNLVVSFVFVTKAGATAFSAAANDAIRAILIANGAQGEFPALSPEDIYNAASENDADKLQSLLTLHASNPLLREHINWKNSVSAVCSYRYQ